MMERANRAVIENQQERYPTGWCFMKGCMLWDNCPHASWTAIGQGFDGEL